MWILALVQLLQVLFTWKHPRYWILKDVKEFVANGSLDSLLRTFHAKRGLVRGTAITVTSILAALPAGWNWTLIVMIIGDLALQGGYWLWYFNPALNIARNLPYVGEYHVSWNPNAAWIDRYIWNKAWKQVRLPEETTPPAKEDFRVIAIAGPMCKAFLKKILCLGVSIYLIALLTVLLKHLLI